MRPSFGLPLEFLRRERGLVARFALASLGRAALAASAILLIREFLGGVLGRQDGLALRLADRFGPGGALWGVAALLVVTQLAAAGLAYDAQVSQQRIVKSIELGTMERLIRHLLGLSVGFFDRRTHGDLIQAVRQDVSHLRTVAIAGATMLLESAQAAGLIAAAATLHATLALWAFVVVPLAAFPIWLLARRTLARSFGVRRKGVVLFDVLLQLLRGIRIIKIYQGERAEASRTTDRARGYFDELIQMERVRARARVVLDALAALSMVAVVIVGGTQVMSGALGWPELLAFLMAARAAQGPLNNINTAYMEIQRYGASVASIEALLAERPTVAERPDARPYAGSPGRVVFDHVTFGFGGAPVLHDVSFEARAGETLGVVGASGAGKTTLLNLVSRFYDPLAGCVSFDGQDLRELRLADVHDRIAIVTQEPFLFATSIRENIRCGRPSASDADVELAARAAEIHDDIVAMPDGYDTVVGHGGRVLSGGEAQRVNVARAILKNAPVLLLDEATSSLDSYAEARVQRALDRLAAGRLTISVAHRLSTLRNAARILVLENGRVVGLDAHRGLLAHCPAYRRLWDAQAAPAPAVAERGARVEAGEVA